jgi:hypothetical protein
MGHPIHKHMGGMKSAERYDAKEAYNKDLSSKARMHYLENDIADKKGSPAHMEGGRKDHKMSNSEYSAHLQSPKGKKEHGAGMSRYSVEKGPHAPHGDAPHRNSSPANNVSYGDKSGKTGYIGGMSRYESVKKERKDLNTINPVDDKAGISRAKYGGNKDDESMSKRDY